MNLRKTVLRILLPALLILTLLPGVRADECPHEWVERRIEPTCEGSGMVWKECLLCGDTADYDILDALEHTFGDWYVLTEPTCTRDGVQAQDCTVCGHQQTAPLPPMGHSYVPQVRKPTCGASGYTRYNCQNCSSYYIADYTEPLGHSYDSVVLLKEPTETAKGRVRFTCIRCSESYLMYYTFRDIDPDAFYFIPVLWAVNSGITSGVDETHFNPAGTCTRAQVVTFLWSSAGKPEPESLDNPFVDVPRGSFCERAVLWAYEMGITKGTDATHFSPNAPCTRAHVVTFLYQFRGCPEPTIATAFPDVRPTDFYYKAVLWAAQRGITAGMDGGYFRPAALCNRAQIVTFLYRDAKKT